MKATFRTMLMFVLLALVVGCSARAVAQDQKPPQTIDLSTLKFEIVDATFVKELAGVNAHFSMATNADKYRGLVLTLKVTKPAGEELKIACVDIVLHYRYGQKTDVTRCYGLSTYSTQPDSDRAMALYASGIGSSTTGLATTKASTVFIDVFFQGMEPETSDLYILIAQPVGTYFKTGGWKN